jgi:hypothetical protein
VKEEDAFELREHRAIGSSGIVQTTNGFDVVLLTEVLLPFCAKDVETYEKKSTSFRKGMDILDILDHSDCNINC